MNTRRALLLSSTMLGSAGGGLERTLHARQRAQLPAPTPGYVEIAPGHWIQVSHPYKAVFR